LYILITIRESKHRDIIEAIRPLESDKNQVVGLSEFFISVKQK